jgi:RNA polymerase sigma factor (sigma-70 family)
MKIPEAELIEGCMRGERASQKILYQQFAPKMMGVCRRYFNDVSEAEDVLQDGFIKVFENIKNYRNEGSFEGWIRRIMVNTSLNAYRSNLKNQNLYDIEDIQEELSHDANITGHFSVSILLKMIDNMPKGYKMVFNLYEMEGFSHKEIAGLLKVSENTSKSQLVKAKKYLRNKINELGVNEI